MCFPCINLPLLLCDHVLLWVPVHPCDQPLPSDLGRPATTLVAAIACILASLCIVFLSSAFFYLLSWLSADATASLETHEVTLLIWDVVKSHF